MIRILAARHVLPVSSDPIADGAIAVNGATIEAGGPLAQLAKLFPAAPVIDFGEAAILPGFVNCHSHLEITSMRGALDDVEHDFSSWLLKLTAIRGEMSDSEI